MNTANEINALRQLVRQQREIAAELQASLDAVMARALEAEMEIGMLRERLQLQRATAGGAMQRAAEKHNVGVGP